MKKQMDWFSLNSLIALTESINGKFVKILDSITNTFKEVYKNIEDVDAKTFSLSYLPDTEEMYFSSSPYNTGYDSDTETLSFTHTPPTS